MSGPWGWWFDGGRKRGVVYSIVGIIVLVLDIIALVKLWGGSSSIERKLLWTVLILLLPILGMVLYFLIGQEAADA
jgi:phospholipase D-like protein